MNLLKEIKNRGSIDESLFPLIFGKMLEDEDYWYEAELDLPRLSRNIILFYFGLTQAYCFARCQYENKTLNESSIASKIVKPISRVWDADAADVFSAEGEIFSYFITCSGCDDENLFTAETRDLLVSIYKDYETIASKNSRAMLNSITPSKFFDFLASLPLLKNTKFSNNSMKLEMKLVEGRVSIKASPFISFLSFENGPIGELVDKFTYNAYVLFSVSKGDANNELIFDTVRLDETGSDSDNRRLCRNLKSNENLVILCKTADIKTQWYSSDDCWCDLKFLNKMVEATENVLLECCGIRLWDRQIQAAEDITEKFKLVFKNTELYDNVSRYTAVTLGNLNEILFDLFLTEGLFKTVRSILHNPLTADRKAAEMFELYLSTFVSMGIIDKNREAQLITLSERQISSALDKLSHIVSKKSEIFKRRRLEIQAEWETFFILQGAGVKSDNLFADVETILSIDDYYDMIENDDSTIESDLIQLLETMCVFYAALVENTSPFDEQKYYEDAEKLAVKYVSAGHSLETLFDLFMDIAKKCEEKPHINELLGRRGISNNSLKYLSFYKKQILSEMSRPSPRKLSTGSTGYGIFVSYAHEDYDLVKPIIERWREMRLNFFFDESDIHHGQNWQRVAEDAMDRNDCKLVVAFCSKNSVCKEAVSLEIEHANQWRQIKYPEDEQKQSMYIIPINLEKEPIKDYLPKIANTHPSVNTCRAYAKRISKCISGEDVYIDYHTTSPDQLDEAIWNDYDMLANGDGRVIAPFKFDPFKLAVANFYAFLKYGGDAISKDADSIDSYFNNENESLSKCIFPIVASVEEARIKRDNIAIVGYELIRGKGRKKARLSHILTSRTLEIYDYYCIPKYRNSGELKDWMIEPLLIRCDKFIEILSKAKEKNNA